ncbi:hypothetical protein HZB88_02715 [archaeon]|nr:hypothetical protein [archaeon]
MKIKDIGKIGLSGILAVFINYTPHGVRDGNISDSLNDFEAERCLETGKSQVNYLSKEETNLEAHVHHSYLSRDSNECGHCPLGCACSREVCPGCNYEPLTCKCWEDFKF